MPEIRLFLIAVTLAALLLPPPAGAGSVWECQKPVAANEVRVFELPNYSGRCKSFKLEPHMRHRLVVSGTNIYRKGSDKRWSVKAGKKVVGLFFTHEKWQGNSLLTMTDFPNLNDPMQSLIVFPRHKSVPDGVSIIRTTGKYKGNIRYFPLPERQNQLSITFKALMDDLKGAKIKLYGDVATLITYWDHSVSANKILGSPANLSVIFPTPDSKKNIFYADTYNINVIEKCMVTLRIRRNALEQRKRRLAKGVTNVGPEQSLDRLGCKRMSKVVKICYNSWDYGFGNIEVNTSAKDPRRFTFKGDKVSGSGYFCNKKVVAMLGKFPKFRRAVGEIRGDRIEWDNRQWSDWINYPPSIDPCK